MKSFMVVAVVALLIGLAVGWMLRPDPSADIRYRTVHVEREAIEALEPDTIVRWRERIVYRTVPIEQVAIADSAGVDDIEDFCDAAGFVRRGETPERGESPERPTVGEPALLLVRSWSRDGGSYTVTGPASDGSLRQLLLEGVRGTKYQARVSGDTVRFQQHRWWFVEPTVKAGGGAAAGAAAGGLVGGEIGAIVGAAVGGIAGAVASQ